MERASLFSSRAPVLLEALVITLSHKLRNSLMGMTSTLELMQVKKSKKKEEEEKEGVESLFLERLSESLQGMQGWVKELELLYPCQSINPNTKIDVVPFIRKICEEESLVIQDQVEVEGALLPVDEGNASAIFRYLLFYLSIVSKSFLLSNSSKRCKKGLKGSLRLSIKKGSFASYLEEDSLKLEKGKEEKGAGTVLHLFQEEEKEVLKNYKALHFSLGDFDHLECPGANLGMNLCRTSLQVAKCKFRAMKGKNGLYSFMIWFPSS